MGDDTRDLASLVINHLVDLACSNCSITEEQILQEEDESIQQILAGLLTLHEEIQHREQQVESALIRVSELNQKLETQVGTQAEAIMMLSTPVMEVWTGVLVLPLIGVIDAARAQQITEQALAAVVEHGASTLLIDITGVPVVDTATANHLLNTFGAVALLGARVIVTGMSPSNALALVNLGVDLRAIATRSSLKAGLKLALNQERRPARTG